MATAKRSRQRVERPRDSAETFERIVDRAMTLIADEGAKELSLRRVAAASQCSLGTVQYYFPSKDALIDSCLKRQNDLLIRRGEHALAEIASGKAPIDAAVDLVKDAFRHCCGSRQLVRLRLIAIMQGDSLTQDGQERFLYIENRKLADLVATVVPLEASEARLVAQSVSSLVARYAAFDADELCSVVGTTKHSEALAAVEKHLARMTRRLLS